MPYFRNEPIGTDDLDISQPKLVVNTNGADDSFGVNHYQFSDTSANNGLHNLVVTPPYVAVPITNPPTVSPTPPTTTASPAFYAFQQTSPLGVLQYSKGPSDAVPSPVTFLHSTTAAITLASNATTNVMDFTGLSYAIFDVYIIAEGSGGFGGSKVLQFISGAGTPFVQVFTPNINGFSLVNTGNILQIKNTSAGSLNIYWTVKFARIII